MKSSAYVTFVGVLCFAAGLATEAVVTHRNVVQLRHDLAEMEHCDVDLALCNMEAKGLRRVANIACADQEACASVIQAFVADYRPWAVAKDGGP